MYAIRSYYVPSRHLVFMPSLGNMGISQRIEAEDERQRLRELLNQVVETGEITGGYIARTAAEGVDEVSLKADMRRITSYNVCYTKLLRSPA